MGVEMPGKVPFCCSHCIADRALVAWISEEILGQKIPGQEIPGQKMVPWWAACSMDKHLDLREGGTTMRSL